MVFMIAIEPVIHAQPCLRVPKGLMGFLSPGSWVWDNLWIGATVPPGSPFLPLPFTSPALTFELHVCLCKSVRFQKRKEEGYWKPNLTCISENNPLFKCQNTLKFARATHILNTDLNFMFNWAPCVLSCNSLLGALRPGALWQADCGRRTMTSSLALPRDFMLSYCSVSFKPHPLGAPGSLFLKQSLSNMEQQEPRRVKTSILSQAVQLEAT